MSDASEFQIGGQTVLPGETRNINLFVAKLYDFTDMYMPIKVIRGKEDGPTLFVSATIHGDEVNGIEIIKRLLKNKALKKLRGTLIAIPIVNVFGFNNMNRYLPDRRDLNRCFPGAKKGSMTARLAHLFISEIVDKCTHGIDLHTGSLHRTNLPQIRACLKDPQVSRLANEFDVPVIMNADLIEGSLRMEAFKRNIPLLVFEGGEPLRYNEVSIRCGLGGVLSVMRALEMIPADPKRVKRVKSYTTNDSYWERAPHSGILIIKKKLGSLVSPGDVLGVISDPLGNNDIRIVSKGKGIIVGNTQMPLVNQGDALFHVATFDKTGKVAESMEQFDDKFDYQSGA